MSLTRTCPDIDATWELAAALARRAFPGMVIGLDGALGAGKTAFCKGFAHALGVRSRVVSPTYQLVAVYEEGRLPLWHADLYRLSQGACLDDLALDEAVEGVLLVEWASRSLSALPEGRIEVEIAAHGEVRTFSMRASDQPHERVLEALGGL